VSSQAPPVVDRRGVPPSSSPTGLTAAEVAERVRAGLVNASDERTSRTVGEIVRANVLTPFNFLLGALGVVVLVTGRLGDALFLLVLVINSLIGIVQEVLAKRKLDRLALLHAPTTKVVRDGETAEVPSHEVVLDDLIELAAGDQVPADGDVLHAAGLEVDESTLTGESDAVDKAIGDLVLSGTIVVAGSGRFHAQAVGPDAYARRVAAEAKVFTRTRSELLDGINQLLKYITWAIVGVTPLLLWSQWRTNDSHDWRDPVVGSVAALVGMVPEGLVLLTSVAFLLAAVALTRQQVLVQQLPAVEGLARVDVVCTDKTGTLTEGDIAFEALDPVGDHGDVRSALGALADDPSPNGTFKAVGAAIAPPDGWTRTDAVPFSSARKWSAASFAGRGTWVFGAPDMLLADDDPLRTTVAELSGQGKRVLLLATSPTAIDGERRPEPLEPAGLCILTEQVRPDAADTFAYFGRQGVGVRVISGDNPTTVAAVARQVGLEVGDAVNANDLGDEPEDLADAVRDETVFGRVRPEQKRSMVKALQAQDHTVAMTGDGVNDALALKDADIGVAMGNGAQATKAVAELVLLDGRFAHLPDAVAEGRRVIGNVERVANLFLSKNTSSFMLILLSAVAGLPFPFEPRQLTLISGLTIGIPGFFLALGPNNARYRPGFLGRVMRFAVPAGVVSSIATFTAYLMARLEHVPPSERRTAATVAALVVALWILAVLARPFRVWKAALVASMAGLAALAFVVPVAQDFFALDIGTVQLVQALVIGAGGAVLIEIIGHVAKTEPTDVAHDHAEAPRRTVPTGPPRR
jgi:cation-transporting P-type ATPase E